MMIERNNTAIDVDDVMARIHREVTRRHFGPDIDLLTSAPLSKLDTTAIESQLSVAQARSEIRTSWSERFNVFPFTAFHALQTLSLRIFSLLFKDQRHVNFALIAALRETLQINRDLHERISLLERRLHQRE